MGKLVDIYTALDRKFLKGEIEVKEYAIKKKEEIRMKRDKRERLSKKEMGRLGFLGLSYFLMGVALWNLLTPVMTMLSTRFPGSGDVITGNESLMALGFMFFAMFLSRTRGEIASQMAWGAGLQGIIIYATREWLGWNLFPDFNHQLLVGGPLFCACRSCCPYYLELRIHGD